jgi:ribonuclease D
MSRYGRQRGKRVEGSATFVDTAPGLAALVSRLSSQPAIALDTESNSLYAYQEQVCLVQISIPGEDFIVDPLAGFDISPLAPVVADASVLKVFHAAEYDVMCLKRDFGIHFSSLFDTMWAARILGWKRVGLGPILREVFDVQTSKRYQRYNWGKRPLDPEALAYARLDTHYLLPLQQLQMEHLSREGRLEEAREVFDEVAATGPANSDLDPDGFWRIKGAYDMSRREAAVLRELYLWRDREAARVDRPHFKVVSDNALSALARARPASAEELGRVEALPARNARRYGHSLLEAIRRGERAKKPRPPSKPRPPEEVVERFEALRSWRKNAAKGRGVDVDVVLGNAVLWELAKADPRGVGELKSIKGLGDWKRGAYGDGIVQTLRSHRARSAP